MSTRRVFIRDLELLGSIGVHEREKLGPQRIVVNVDLTVDEEGGLAGDDIEHVVSYEEAVRRIEVIVAAGHVNLVETLAETIATACLEDRRVLKALVRVEKPDIIANARSVGVEIERTRQVHP